MIVAQETIDDYREAIRPVKERYPGVKVLIAFGEDWGGEPAVFFTVVFPEDRLPNEKWAERASECTWALSSAVFEKGLARFPYYEVHSQETYDVRGSNRPSSVE